MKRIFLLLVVAACGSSTTGDDAGSSADSGKDDVVTSNDAAIVDSSSDVATQGDGGIAQGEPCDPQNNQCLASLLCCSEPIHGGDAMSGYFCEQPTGTNQCPMLP